MFLRALFRSTPISAFFLCGHSETYRAIYSPPIIECRNKVESCKHALLVVRYSGEKLFGTSRTHSLYSACLRIAPRKLQPLRVGGWFTDTEPFLWIRCW